MDKWEENTGPRVIDHVTDYRLSRDDFTYVEDLATTWWSVLIEIADTSIDQFQEATRQFSDDLLIPVAYDAAERARVLKRQPVTIFARLPLITALNLKPNPYHVTSIHLGGATPERFLNFNATPAVLPDVTVCDDTVVMAVIDNGIAIAHDLFWRGPVKSRVHYAAILEAEPDRTSSHISLGRALGQEEIDRLLKDCSFNGLLDEDQFYAQSGQIDLVGDALSAVARRTSHGTHVSALAAGHYMEEDCANRPLLAAILPSRLVSDMTGLDLLPDLYLAFHILRKQAQRFKTVKGKIAPVVFNFSYGNTGGPHDGTGLFATLFEHYFGPNSEIDDHQQKAWLVLPAGNNNLSRLHAVEDGGAKKSRVTLDLAVLPDDRTPTTLQAWMPTGPQEEKSGFAMVYVTTPRGLTRAMITTQKDQSVSLLNELGKEIARLSYQFTGGATTRGVVNLTINPTAHLEKGAQLAPAGAWKIEIDRNTCASPLPIHIWIRRDETLPGSKSGGRQAFFDAPDYQKYDRFGAPLPVDPPESTCPVRRATTLSGFGCGPSPIIVAGYTQKEADLSVYSAAGPLNPRSLKPKVTREGPDLAAKADESIIRRGVLSAGSRSGTWARLSGTSVAAPRVARAAAEHIGEHKGSGRDWSHQAVVRSPFPLKGDPSVTRAGSGGFDVPVWSKGRGPER